MPAVSEVAMIDVMSSNLQSIGYDESKATLYVRFKASSWLYLYEPLPPIVWLGLRECQSKGSYLRTQVIPFFRCRRIKQ